MHILRHEALGQAPQTAVIDGRKTAALLYLPGDLLEHIVHEGADLGRCEAVGLVGPGLQAVLAEVGVAAGGEAVDARSAQPRPPAVERLHSLGGETAARTRRGLAEPGKAFGIGLPEPGGRGGSPGPAALYSVGGKRERRCGGGEPGFVRIGGLRLQAEQRTGAVKDKGGAQRFPVCAADGTAEQQALRRQSQCRVKQREFPPQFPFTAAEIDVETQQSLALLVGEDAAALVGGREPVVRAAEHDEVADAAAAHTVKIARGDAVERDRDQADVVLREHMGEQAPEGAAVHRGVAEDGGALFERGDQDIPELAVFGGALGLPCRLECGGARLELLGQLPVGEQSGQRGGLLFGGRGALGARGKAQQRFGKTAAQGVDAAQLLLALFVKAAP